MKNIYWFIGGTVAAFFIYKHFEQKKKIEVLQQLKNAHGPREAIPAVNGFKNYSPYAI